MPICPLSLIRPSSFKPLPPNRHPVSFRFAKHTSRRFDVFAVAVVSLGAQGNWLSRAEARCEQVVEELPEGMLLFGGDMGNPRAEVGRAEVRNLNGPFSRTLLYKPAV